MLEGRVALVTGSTSGIGLGIARALAEAGAQVMLNGFGDKEEIERTRARIAVECGVKTGYHGADLMLPDGPAALVAATERVFGRLDILVTMPASSTSRPSPSFPTSAGTRSSRSISRRCSGACGRRCRG